MAGQVKARGERRRTRSDWMEIEQKRGISVTSSVMTFEHQGLTYNLLDTPGHADFSEDTYRTLTAVDAVVMVIDAAKGIESQTLKLFEVCRLRDIPIITFVNKVDREGRDPLEILDEISETLALDVVPGSWPIGLGVDFKGVVNLSSGRMTLPDGSPGAISLSQMDEWIETSEVTADPVYGPALEGMSIARETLPPFDLQSYREGHLTPVFFGSALKSVGIEDLLQAIGEWAPSPRPQPAEPAPIDPASPTVTGFVFKVQANMEPNHRDRIAFLRLSSGTFRRGMKLRHPRLGRDITITSPMLFFAQERETADEAVAGDIIGIPNHGTLSVGDTLCEDAETRVTGIPNFAPELIRRVRLSDPMKAKQLGKALNDLAEEGVTQVFRPMIGADWLVGVVGSLQLDVLSSRLEKECRVPASLESAGFETARWIASDDPKEFKRFVAANRASLAEDRATLTVFLARNPWTLERTQKDWPQIRFLKTRERS
ncbi:Peptide chain release factor 3 [Lutibaculum baratangense AMV1]|uniref:Peptide chain release factor 3 n=1 Tax=Lutibaculum baratangense AMV1 TaxID=631454 RepID=V4R0E1_9HYPH|nr:Peptide chain release factor 3 [Lutibaculum baratangense AMV1]